MPLACPIPAAEADTVRRLSGRPRRWRTTCARVGLPSKLRAKFTRLSSARTVNSTWPRQTHYAALRRVRPQGLTPDRRTVSYEPIDTWGRRQTASATSPSPAIGLTCHTVSLCLGSSRNYPDLVVITSRLPGVHILSGARQSHNNRPRGVHCRKRAVANWQERTPPVPGRRPPEESRVSELFARARIAPAARIARFARIARLARIAPGARVTRRDDKRLFPGRGGRGCQCRARRHRDDAHSNNGFFDHL